MYTNLLKAWKGAKKLPSTIYICLEITFFWKLKERPYDHVMYVYLPFCAFLGTNDVYLSQHAVNPTSCSDFCGQHLLDCVTVSESSRRIEYHYFKRWLLIYEARVRPLLDATRKKNSDEGTLCCPSLLSRCHPAGTAASGQAIKEDRLCRICRWINKLFPYVLSVCKNLQGTEISLVVKGI